MVVWNEVPRHSQCLTVDHLYQQSLTIFLRRGPKANHHPRKQVHPPVVLEVSPEQSLHRTMEMLTQAIGLRVERGSSVTSHPKALGDGARQVRAELRAPV